MRATSVLAVIICACGAASGEDSGKRLPLDQIPAAAKATILAQAHGAEVKDVEKEDKGGRTVYEAEFTAGGVTTEVKVAADGTLLKTTVETEDDGKHRKH